MFDFDAEICIIVMVMAWLELETTHTPRSHREADVKMMTGIFTLVSGSPRIPLLKGGIPGIYLGICRYLKRLIPMDFGFTLYVVIIQIYELR